MSYNSGHIPRFVQLSEKGGSGDGGLTHCSQPSSVNFRGGGKQYIKRVLCDVGILHVEGDSDAQIVFLLSRRAPLEVPSWRLSLNPGALQGNDTVKVFHIVSTFEVVQNGSLQKENV